MMKKLHKQRQALSLYRIDVVMVVCWSVWMSWTVTTPLTGGVVAVNAYHPQPRDRYRRHSTSPSSRRWEALPRSFLLWNGRPTGRDDFLEECESVLLLLQKLRGGGDGWSDQEYNHNDHNYYSAPSSSSSPNRENHRGENAFYQRHGSNDRYRPLDDHDENFDHPDVYGKEEEEEEEDDYYAVKRPNGGRKDSHGAPPSSSSSSLLSISTSQQMLNAIPGVIRNGDRRIGLTLLGSGAVITMLGISLFFNKTLMRMGNLLFIAGVPMTLGPTRTMGYFLQPDKTRATACLGLGIFLVLMGRTILGLALEIFGILNLFGNMFPVVLAVAKTMPGIGPLLNNLSNQRGNSKTAQSKKPQRDNQDYYYYDEEEDWDRSEDRGYRNYDDPRDREQYYRY